MMTIVIEFISHDLKEVIILVVALLSAEKVSKHLHTKAKVTLHTIRREYNGK